MASGELIKGLLLAEVVLNEAAPETHLPPAIAQLLREQRPAPSERSKDLPGWAEAVRGRPQPTNNEPALQAVLKKQGEIRRGFIPVDGLQEHLRRWLSMPHLDELNLHQARRRLASLPIETLRALGLPNELLASLEALGNLLSASERTDERIATSLVRAAMLLRDAPPEEATAMALRDPRAESQIQELSERKALS